LDKVPTFLLTHRHSASECRSAFAAWHGFDSPLRHGRTISSCLQGGHRLWWTVEAPTTEEALTLLPPFVAERSEVTEVGEVPIP
jgi:hypothetical protein